ncbi:MFS transporter [Clostridium sp. DJ247]|uniref:MFS transporter n=1 Tax=Clostridium sp. DJ247 TaxID=2726188 RepID=UPI001628AEF4|nr:MFS transporter [Clostridium sp. DJ247]MBC2578862.1 MFS transporter [Clostridium sp. DJ247]
MKKLFKLAILSLSLLTVMSGAAVAPALGIISRYFSDVNPVFIKMILTLPAFFIIPFTLISGKLVSRLNKKTIVIIGLCLYILGGIGGGFARTIYELLFFRAILGIGVGLIMPLSTGLIADFFTNEERIKMIGYSAAVNNLGGIIATLASGLLAAISWRYSFGVYFMGVLVFLLVIFALPEPERKAEIQTEKSSLSKNVFKMAFSGFIITIIFYTVPTNLSLFLTNEGIGGAGTSGVMISLMTFSSFLLGMSFSKIINYLQKSTVIFSLTSLLIGFLLLSLANSIYIVVLGVIFIGAGLGILMPLIMLNTAKSTQLKAHIKKILPLHLQW